MAYAIGYLSRFMEEPCEEHLTAMKRVLCYIAGTKDLSLYYGQNGNDTLNLVGYSDSDVAGDVDTRKSTTGNIFFLAGSPITWQS
jgi:hypothetical protein